MIENAVGLQRRLLEQKLTAGLSDLRDSVAQEKAAREELQARFRQVAAPYAQALADSRAAAILS